MERKYIYIAVFVVSVIGLTIVQYKYLEVGLKLAQTQFSDRMERSADDIREGLRNRNELTFLLASAFRQDTTFFTTSPGDLTEASSFFLRDYLRERLMRHGIENDFTYVLKTRDARFYLQGPADNPQAFESGDYPVALEGYLPESFGRSFVLHIRFRRLDGYFLSQLNGLTLPSLLFLLGITITVIWALRTYYWQTHRIKATHEFLNNLTHELRTPVFSIQLANRLLQEGNGTNRDQLLSVVRQQTERLSEHIDRVLQLAQLENARGIFEQKEVDLRPGLQQLCQEFAELTGLEGGRFRYELGDQPLWIFGDSWHLINAISNVLDNARKYSDDPDVYLGARKEGHRLCVEVRDKGRGIPKKELGKVFQKFYRVQQGNLHAVKGFGLGLNYTRTVVSKHKGKWDIQSEPGVGTTVRLWIPLAKQDGTR